MAKVFVSIGSNVDRESNIARALTALSNAFGRLEASSIYECDPVGFEGEPFFNLVVGFSSTRPPEEIVSEFRAIEAASGRRRGDQRYGPRTLDLDLLLYGDLILDRNGITLPRPEISEFAFVLRPLAEMAGETRHPVTGERFADMWKRLDRNSQQLAPVDLDVDRLLSPGSRSRGPDSAVPEPAGNIRGDR